jgi:hypothetical protein
VEKFIIRTGIIIIIISNVHAPNSCFCLFCLYCPFVCFVQIDLYLPKIPSKQNVNAYPDMKIQGIAYLPKTTTLLPRQQQQEPQQPRPRYNRISVGEYTGWIMYLPLVSEPTRIIIHGNNYNKTSIEKALIEFGRLKATLNGFSLKACIQCNKLCFPANPCGQSCIYSGTYNCDSCNNILKLNCILCDSNYHTKCHDVHTRRSEITDMLEKTCFECIKHMDDEPLYDDYHGVKNTYCCEWCLELDKCYMVDCIEPNCGEHKRQCQVCHVYGCIFHILCLPRNYKLLHPNDSTYLTCIPCHRKPSVLKCIK